MPVVVPPDGIHKPKTPIEEMSYAVEDGNLEEVKRLHAAGVSVNAILPAKWTPLILAVAQGEVETARYLLEKGADVRATNILGFTALHYAARYGNKRLCDLLVKFGADLDARDLQYKETPLISAALGGHNACVSYLLEKGADASIQARGGKTAESLARKTGHGTTARLIVQALKNR